MKDTVVALYDTAEHANQAVDALRRAGVPEACIHRQIFDGDLTSEHHSLVKLDKPTTWLSFFDPDEGDGDFIYEDAEEAGGTVVRVTHIPAERYEAVLDIIERYHPADVLDRTAP